MISLVAMSFRDMSRKGWTRGGVGVHLKGANNMTMSGLSFRKPLVGTGWFVSLLLCMIEVRKQSSHLAGPSFLAWKVSHRQLLYSIEISLMCGRGEI